MTQPLDREKPKRAFAAQKIEIRNESVTATLVKGKRYVIETRALRHTGKLTKIDKAAGFIILKDGFTETDPIHISDITSIEEAEKKGPLSFLEALF